MPIDLFVPVDLFPANSAAQAGSHVSGMRPDKQILLLRVLSVISIANPDDQSSQYEQCNV
jgi:hypothetical protein